MSKKKTNRRGSSTWKTDKPSRRKSSKPDNAESAPLKDKVKRLEKKIASLERDLEKESAEKKSFRGQIERAGAGIGIFDEKGEFTYVNKKLSEMLRTPKKNLLGSKFQDLIPEKNRKEVTSIISARKGRMPSTLEAPIMAGRDDETLHMLLSVQPLYSSSGRFEGNLAVFTDVTERKKVLDELEALKEFNEMIVRNSPLGIFTLDESGVMTSENPAQRAFLADGRSAVGKNLLEAPEIRETGLDRHIREALSGRTVMVQNFPYRSIFTQKTAFVTIHFVPLVDDEGKTRAALCMLDDTTEKTQMELEQAIAANIVENTRDAVISGDFHGNVFTWNPAAEELYGFTREEIIEKGNLQIPGEQKEELENFRKILESEGRIENYETTRRHKDGRLIEVSLTVNPLRDEDGKIFGVAAIHRDITERKQREEEITRAYEDLEKAYEKLKESEALIRESEARYRLSAEHIPMHLGAIDRDGVFTMWNRHSEKMLGYSVKAAVGRLKAQDLFDAPGEAKDVFDRAGRAGLFQGEVELVHKDGKPVPCSLVLVPRKNDDGEVESFYSFAEDISERKKNESEREKLDRIKDEILGVVSYELRNPLVTVLGYLDLLLDGKLGDLEDECVKGLSIAKRNVLRLDRITQDLLVFSQLQVGEEGHSADFFSLEDLVALAVADIKVRSEKENLLINTRLPKNMPLVLANEQLIRQVFLNLLSNAEKFSGMDVTIEIKAEIVDDEHVGVTITDNGIGIPREARDLVFEKFYQLDTSTGRKHMGLGIGLALVKKILDMYNCEIEISDNPEGGTKVYFELPRAKVTDQIIEIG